MSHSAVLLKKQVSVSRKYKFKKKSKALVRKDCGVKVIHHPKDCACHKPVSKQRFDRDRCFEIIKGVKPLIQLRLAGLNTNLNFELLRNEGKPVIIEVVSGEKIEKIQGTLCQIGTNYVDIRKADGKVVTILQDSIHKIEWLKGKKRIKHDHQHDDYFDDEYYGDETDDFEE
ncbi:hypothetical protein M3231_04035 [Neobacillus mesonae]|nr:hypothetical protein [Neobacillus mesonae]